MGDDLPQKNPLSPEFGTNEFLVLKTKSLSAQRVYGRDLREDFSVKGKEGRKNAFFQVSLARKCLVTSLIGIAERRTANAEGDG